MSRYDGLIIPRSYSEYINKTDAATLQQALQLSGVLSGAVAAGDNKAVKSSAVNAALANYEKITKESISDFNLSCNNFTDHIFTIFNTNKQASNIPVARYGFLTTYQTSGNRQRQFYYVNESPYFETYTRIGEWDGASWNWQKWEKVVTSSRISTNINEATLLLRNEDSKVFGEFAITPINDISKWFSFCQITQPKNRENVVFTLTENGISPATPLPMFILGSTGLVQNQLTLTAGKRYYGTFYYEI